MFFMLVTDEIYGKVEVNEPVLTELINSKAMPRLKKIPEAPVLVNPLTSYSRYEHCVGVMLLLRRFNASVEEQIAGLLHDVSHTAFSHLVDWAIGNVEKQDYQDTNHLKYIMTTDIPGILERNGFDVKRVTELKSFGLLEREIPDLCGDRIDYALRNFKHWENADAVAPTLNALAVRNGKFVFDSASAARIFADNYLKCQTQAWGNVKYTTNAHIFAKIIRAGLDQKIISIGDLYTYDEYVLEKLRKGSSSEINLLFKVLEDGVKYKLVDTKADMLSRKKLRYVDPLVLGENGSTSRLSKIDPEFDSLLKQYIGSPPHNIKFEYPQEITKALV